MTFCFLNYFAIKAKLNSADDSEEPKAVAAITRTDLIARREDVQVDALR